MLLMVNLSIDVSILVISYNQRSYIADCIKGIFKQKVSFGVEVIIGDDASSDGTANLIEELLQGSPFPVEFIKRPLNIGAHKNGLDVIERARGQFIAICEGDDYWVAPFKLQKQYDALQRHPDIDLCFHPAKEYRNEKFHRVICKHFDEETIVPLEQVIAGGGGYMPTASLMIRKSAIYPFPDWFIERAPAGDTFIQALGSKRGGALYLPDSMSMYRRFSDNSMTSKNASPVKGIENEIISSIKGYIICYSALGGSIAIQKALSSAVFESINKLVLVSSYNFFIGSLKHFLPYINLSIPKHRFMYVLTKSKQGWFLYKTLIRLKRAARVKRLSRI
jgi:glycosyltransferase involved in cell wall biosynthesis